MQNATPFYSRNYEADYELTYELTYHIFKIDLKTEKTGKLFPALFQ